MRLAIVIGAFLLTAGVAFATYVVELDAGDRMAVDEVRVDGDRMHLIRGGYDLSVPRSRVHGVREVGSAAITQGAPPPPGTTR